MTDRFDWTDYAGVVASLVVMFLQSYDACRQEKRRNSIARTLPLSTIAMSLIASFTSGVSLLGKPAESYAYGVDFLCFHATSIVVNIFVLNAVYLPIVDKLDTDSLYEYFDYRFNWGVRKLVSVSFVITRTLQTSLAVLPPALVINKFSGLDVDLLIIGLNAITTICTMIGGFKGVVNTETFQAAVMLAVMASFCVLSVVQVGGLVRVFEIAYETGRLTPPMPTLDPTDRMSLWSYLAFIHACSTMLLNQSSYQRMKALPSLKEMRIAMTAQMLGMLIFSVGSSFIGLCIYAYYYGCDPKEARLTRSTSDVVLFWLNELGQKVRGFRGVYLAGITCASISTISSYLNTVAQVTSKELGNPFKDSSLPVQIATAVLGLLATLSAISFKNSSSLVEMTFAFASLDGITSGLFILGTLIIPANTKGALASGVINILTTLLFALGSRYYNASGSIKPYATKLMRTDLCPFNVSTPVLQSTPQPSPVFYLFRISPFFYAIFAVISTVFVGLVVSLAFPDSDNRGKAPHLFSPLVRRFLPHTPTKSQHQSSEAKRLIESLKGEQMTPPKGQTA